MKNGAFLSTFLVVVSTFHVLAQQLKEVCSLGPYTPKAPNGAFPPWITYKYLKAPSPLITTEQHNGVPVAPEQGMGARVMFIKNAHKKMLSSMFNCVIEDNEWKARVKDEKLAANMLTMEITDGTATQKLCLLQDISLSRNGESLGLRLDYGYCMDGNGKKHLQSKSFVMIGLRMVPIALRPNTPGLKTFFQGVCGGKPEGNPLSTLDPAIHNLDLNAVQRYHYNDLGLPASDVSCFAGSVDVQHMHPAGPGPTGETCFEPSTAFTWLGSQDEFGIMPITEVDYLWLLEKLPIVPIETSPIQVYGRVQVDRYCLYLDGINCNNGCGKFCEHWKPSKSPIRRLMMEELGTTGIEEVLRIREGMEVIEV